MQSVSVSVREEGWPAHAMRVCSQEAWCRPGLLERARSRATGLHKCADRRRRAGLWPVERAPLLAPANAAHLRPWRAGAAGGAASPAPSGRLASDSDGAPGGARIQEMLAKMLAKC